MDFQRIGKYISFSEATKSQTAIREGIENFPNDQEFAKMQLLDKMVFTPLREWHGKPIGISSFFRCLELNRAIKSDDNSQHVKGEAMDIDADIYQNGITNSDIYNYILENLDFDQLIAEGINIDGTFGWVHVSYRNTAENRRQKLRIVFKNGRKIVSVL